MYKQRTNDQKSRVVANSRVAGSSNFKLDEPEKNGGGSSIQGKCELGGFVFGGGWANWGGASGCRRCWFDWTMGGVTIGKFTRMGEGLLVWVGVDRQTGLPRMAVVFSCLAGFGKG
jgi:hypothetical protein